MTGVNLWKIFLLQIFHDCLIYFHFQHSNDTEGKCSLFFRNQKLSSNTSSTASQKRNFVKSNFKLKLKRPNWDEESRFARGKIKKCIAAQRQQFSILTITSYIESAGQSRRMCLLKTLRLIFRNSSSSPLIVFTSFFFFLFHQRTREKKHSSR